MALVLDAVCGARARRRSRSTARCVARRAARAALVFLAATSWVPSVFAQAAPNEQRSAAYYRTNIAAAGALILGYATLEELAPVRNCQCDFAWFPGDEGRRGRSSLQANQISNGLVLVSLAEPELLVLSHEQGWRLLNGSLVYGETMGLNLTLNALAKLLFPRPRPFTYARNRSYDDVSDYNASFYSSHSSNSFAAAVSGSFLYAESAQHSWAKYAAWGSAFALASATANLRVRAGKHYYSDVLVGAVIGSTIGAVVPLLHGARYRPEPGEYLAAGSGLALGLLVSQLLPLSERTDQVSWSVEPYVAAGAVGLQGAGKF